MLEIHLYERDSGEYVYSIKAEYAQAINSIPENLDFTLVKPPDEDNIISVWESNKWVAVRNEDKNIPQLLEYTDDPVEVAQLMGWIDIKEFRQKVIASGVLIPSVNKVFQTDQYSMTQYAQIASMIALDNYTPVEWKTLDNTWVTLTVELLKELQQTIRQRTDRAFAVAEEHKAKMMVSDNPEEYDYSTGWEVSVS